jgi:hypothetical protein
MAPLFSTTAKRERESLASFSFFFRRMDTREGAGEKTWKLGRGCGSDAAVDVGVWVGVWVRMCVYMCDCVCKCVCEGR